MSVFAEVFEETRSTVKGMALPERGKKDPKWDAFAPIDAVWDRLLSGSWPLLPEAEIRKLAPQFQSAFAYGLDITVWQLEFIRGNDLLLGAKPLSWMRPDIGDAIAREVSLSVAEHLGTNHLAKRLARTRPAGMLPKDASVSSISAFDSAEFQAALWHTMVQSHGAGGLVASRMLTATLKEYALHLAAGSWQSAGLVRNMLEVLQYCIPATRAGKNDRSLVLLCGSNESQ